MMGAGRKARHELILLSRWLLSECTIVHEDNTHVILAALHSPQLLRVDDLLMVRDLGMCTFVTEMCNAFIQSICTANRHQIGRMAERSKALCSGIGYQTMNVAVT